MEAADFAKDIAELEAHPESMHEELCKAEGDRWFFDDPERVAMFDAYTREAWRQGLHAIRWELIDVYQPWGFRLADIAIPAYVWHGVQDPWVTQAHIDFTVTTIPNCRVAYWRDSGHLGFVKHRDEVVTTLTRQRGES